MGRGARFVMASAFATALYIGAACTVFDDARLLETIEAGTNDGASSADGAADADTGFLGLADLETAAKVCSLVAECELLDASLVVSLRVGVNVKNFSYCMHVLTTSFEQGRPGRTQVAQLLRQIANATSCPAAARLLYYDFVADPSSPCPRLGTDGGSAADAGGDGGDASAPVEGVYCSDENTLKICDEQSSYHLHCDAIPGQRCVPVDKQALGDPTLPAGLCSISLSSTAPCLGASCDSSGSFLDSCLLEVDAGSAIERYMTERQSCTLLGLRCVTETSRNSVGCAASDGIVRRNNQYLGSYCEGPRLMTTNGHFLGGVDCSELEPGGRCVDCFAAGVPCTAQTQGASCGRADDECTVYGEDVNLCEGTSIKLCVDGRRISFDCASIGRTCQQQMPDAGDGGPSLDYRAACVRTP